MDLVRTTISDQDGRVTMPNVPPGEYELFSWESIDNGAFFDPEVLKRFEQQGRAIRVPRYE